MILRDLTGAERRDWLRLARTETVGPVTFERLIQRFGEPGRALAALPELSRHGGGASPLALPGDAEVDAELADGERLGARLICACEPGFPQALAALDPPPPLIWALGRADILDRSAVAVVGARVASAAGQRFARGLAADLGGAGQIVISGLARGIDGAAHEGALPTGTVAVLGGGIADVYPPEHRALHAQIAEQGCIVSESPPTRVAQAKDFPRRNRIIAGLSRAVVVVEAEQRSGSLITARLALEQGREVLAVPGSPLDPRAKGPNDLIRQGAALCEGIDDVLRALEGFTGLRERDPAPYVPPPLADGPTSALIERIAALLSPTPVPCDELVRTADAPAALVIAALVELSLAGRANLLPGGLATGA